MNTGFRISAYSLCVAMSVGAAAVAAEPSASAQAATSAERSTVVHVRYSGERLGAVAQDLERRSGIAITVPPGLAGDRLSKDVRAGTWSEAVAQILRGYDYAAETDDQGNVRRILLQTRITKIADASAPRQPARRKKSATPAAADNGTGSDGSGLPKRFRGLNPSSVAPIDLSLSQLDRLKRGDSFTLGL
ncbi:MAG: hypothetical protein MUF20_13875, partial [Methylotetracoccus sp.]|nr:hypothetical protein [Methylotetracoccus sp.]